MKSFKSRLAIIVAMMVFVTSFTFIGVSAEDENQNAAPVAAAESMELAAPAAEAAAPAANTPEEAKKQEQEKQVEPPAPVTLTAYASNEAVVFLWNVDTPDVKYLFNGQPITPLTYTNPRTGQTFNRYDVSCGAGLNGTPGEGGVATATVVAYRLKGDGSTRVEAAPATASGAAVKTIRYRLTIKSSGTLKSHGGPKSTIKVKKGQKIDAYGFGGGKYIFKNEIGSVFYCNMTRTGKKTCVYEKAWNYSREEAEFFVNSRGISSRTGALIWINTYTQHLYRFTGSAGNWVCVNDFDCSTGKAKTPSPTGVSGKKAIWKKIKTRHGIPYWSPYSDINSIHAKRKGWKIGTPSSNGCVRNYKQNAYDVYVNAPIGTAVLLF